MEEDTLSGLEDGILHKILSCLDMKFAVQTCVLSSRWEFVWTSMPYLNFWDGWFDDEPKFANFVTHVLSHRDHQAPVSSVKLHFTGVANQAFVRNVANYAFSRNVHELDVTFFHHNDMIPIRNFPPCLFSSQTLKHFKLTPFSKSACMTPKTPWNFPALTTLHLSHIVLCSDLFSKCVNLRDLTLEDFVFKEVGEVFTPQLSNLMLISGRFSRGINLIAPQLENLTVNNCIFKLSPDFRLCFVDALLPQLSKDQFHSLNDVTLDLNGHGKFMPSFKEEDTRNTISVLQELRTARYLTLDANIVDCLSSFPDLLLNHPSPFSNLKCLTVIDFKRGEKNAYQVKMSAQARNFLLGCSPSATFIMKSG